MTVAWPNPSCWEPEGLHAAVTAIPGFLEHCEGRWRYVQDANSGAIDREMERRLWLWSIRRYGHPSYVHRSPSRRNVGASKERTKVIRNFLIASCLVLFASVASAQNPIVIGPSTLLMWDTPGLAATGAQACTYAVGTSASGPFVPLVGTVTCAGAAAPASCSVNLLAQGAAIPIGSGTVVMTATCGGQTSLPSTPFAYVDVVIPIPANVRFR